MAAGKIAAAGDFPGYKAGSRESVDGMMGAATRMSLGFAVID